MHVTIKALSVWITVGLITFLAASPVVAAWPWQLPQQSQPQWESQQGWQQQPMPQAGAPVQPLSRQLRMDEIQTLLDRSGFSVGQIDGQPGGNTVKAVTAFQLSQALPATGELDATTLSRLWEAGGGSPWTNYTLTEADTAGPFIESLPSTMHEKSKMSYLGYTSIYARMGEKFHINPALLRAYNPGISFHAGQTILVPNVIPMELPAARTAAAGQAPIEATIIASKNERTLQLIDSQNRILFHAPITIGGKNDPLPLGRWRVEGVDRNPVYNYDPGLFWDANTSDSKCIVPPGPNNPVGLVWVSLNRAHVGIHGTPSPGRIGYAQSHGCVRLTNWDALRLASLVGRGTNVLFKE